jgi:predicted signal transduction protein with EAL and GGDEF domain
VAGRLRGLAGEVDTVARLGSDEFVVLRSAPDGPDGIAGFARRLIAGLSEPPGVAMEPIDGDGADLLLQRADVALHRAKSDRRDALRFFAPGMDAKLQARHAVEVDLRRALARGEFELHYQPVVRIGTGQVAGVEALLRWRHPARGLVSPAELIPLAEEIGLIVPPRGVGAPGSVLGGGRLAGRAEGGRQPVAGAVPPGATSRGRSRKRWRPPGCPRRGWSWRSPSPS